ncbi:MAG TPA: hypothetical protein P5267_01375 [Patescibacteria group bacterium]|nr:hypothetical protein [Patescibacteria group bacterium]
MSKSQSPLKAEKRETIAKKLALKQKKGATLAGQITRFQTSGKYKGKAVISKIQFPSSK